MVGLIVTLTLANDRAGEKKNPVANARPHALARTLSIKFFLRVGIGMLFSVAARWGINTHRECGKNPRACTNCLRSLS